MKIKFKASMILLMVGLSISPVYSKTMSGTVMNIIVNRGGSIIYLYISEQVGYAPCNSNKRFIFDTSTPDGKNKYALVMLAYATGRTITVSNDGLCNHPADNLSETTNEISSP